MLSKLNETEKIDPRVLRTRIAIEAAFRQVLAEKSFQAISVQDITEKAGVNRTTFYLHFTDKYALLDYAVDQAFHQEMEKRMLNACHFSPENLRALMITVSEFIRQSHTTCGQVDPQFDALVEPQVKKRLQELLGLWAEQASPGSDAKNTATAASWAIYGLALEWNHTKKRIDVESFADQVLPIIGGILGAAEKTA